MKGKGEEAGEDHAPGTAIPAPARRVNAEPVRHPNDTGLPDGLKAGIESLSGISLDDVSVRFGSARPAELGAQAYAQGKEIHIGPGFEQHLPHEAWHVVQQAQGRVRPRAQFGRDVSLNEDTGLEHEADVMGARALREGQRGEEAALPRLATVNGPVRTEVLQAKGRLALVDDVPPLTTEGEIAGLPEDSDNEVVLQRGVTPTQKKYLANEIIRASFVSFAKMLQGPDETERSDVTRPDKELAAAYVRQDSTTAGVDELIEFSTKADIAKTFSGEARYGFVFTIKIKRRYLTKGASGAESGWIARQDAPYEIVRVERSDSKAKDKGLITLTDEEFRAAVADEQTAEFLLKMDDLGERAAYFGGLIGEGKRREAIRLQGAMNNRRIATQMENDALRLAISGGSK